MKSNSTLWKIGLASTLFFTGCLVKEGDTPSSNAMLSSSEEGSSSSVATFEQINLNNRMSEGQIDVFWAEPFFYHDVPENIVEGIKDTTYYPDKATCDTTSAEYTYSWTNYRYEPLYMSWEDYKSSFKNFEEQEFQNPGKIYTYKGNKFVHEEDHGVHVYKVEDPSNPEYLTFLKIPGNSDIAIRGDYLYANSFSNLIAFDVTDLENAKVEHIEVNAFLPTYRYGHKVFDSELGYAAQWRRDEVLEFECGLYPHMEYDVAMMDGDWALSSSSVAMPEQEVTSGVKTPTGQGGSLARFAFGEQNLYFVEHSILRSYNLDNPTQPTQVDSNLLGWGLETLFYNENRLFVGSQTGTYLFDLSNEDKPDHKSTFQHARSCDPIVVEGDMAYVTLRSGNACRNGNNQLDILDISDLSNPELIATHPMLNPAGLAVEDQTLYLCDGKDGIKTYDVSNPEDIDLLFHTDDYECEDVILQDDNLFFVGDFGWGDFTVLEDGSLDLVQFTESEGDIDDQIIDNGPILIDPMPIIEENS